MSKRVDTAQDTARAAAGRFKDRRLRGARRPLPTRRHVKAHRTTLLAILHQPRGEGDLHYCKGLGFTPRSPARCPGPRVGGWSEGRKERLEGVYAQGGTGGL